MTKTLELPLDGLAELEYPNRPAGRGRFEVADGFVEVPTSIEPVAVDIEEGRAALAVVQQYAPLWRRVRGGARAVHDPTSRLHLRYGNDARRVQHGAEQKLKREFDTYKRALGVLAACESLRQNGYDEADVWCARTAIQA